MIDLENIKKDIVNRVLVSSGKRTIHNEVMHGLGLIEELYQAEINDLKQKLARYENPDYVLVPLKPAEETLSNISRELNRPNYGRIDRECLYKAMIEAVEEDNAQQNS